MRTKGADFSLDRIYRYALWRFWGHGQYAAFVCLNPSTANEYNDDPTVRRCIGYAKQWGLDGIVMLNLFAYRSTDPKKLYSVNDPVGQDNDFHIRNASKKAGITIAAWGIRGGYLNRDSDAMKLLTAPMCLGITKNGYPKHPLYLKKNLRPIEYGKTTKR